MLASLALRGRMILIAGRTSRVEFPVGAFYTKCASLYGFAMFLAPAETQRRAAEQINGWLESGALVAKIDRVASLDEAAELHRLQESSGDGAIRGKLVVKI
jgi:NADPH2:quinone reductase